jgi:hypothetical protein
MKFDVLHNFISPVTGRILATTNYVLVGNTTGIAIPSPDLIDLKLDLINLRVDFDVASSASYIIGFPNSRLTGAQVLNSLSDGFIFNTAGLISTNALIPITSLPDLSSGKVWIGNGLSRPVEGDPPQGPAGPQGPRGPGPDDPSNIAGTIGNAVLGGLIKTGIQELFAGAGSLLGGVLGATIGGVVIGGAVALSSGSSDPVSSSLIGPAGAAGTSGQKTVFLNVDMSFSGNRLKDIAPSPQADYDAVNAKWVWDFFNDNVNIIWG